MTWSQTFLDYITRRFGDGAQLKAAFALKVSPSAVSYWCRSSTPRAAMRKRIARWSKGEVPADSAEPSESSTDVTGAHSRAS